MRMTDMPVGRLKRCLMPGIMNDRLRARLFSERYITAILINLVIAIILTTVVRGLEYVFEWFPCVSPWLGSVSIALLLLFALHAMQQYAPGWGKALESGGPFGIKLLGAIGDFIHPRSVPERLWPAALALSLLFLAVVFSPFSPFPSPQRSVPAIKGFVVAYPDGSRAELGLDDTLTVRAGEKVLIEITFLNEANPECAWTAFKGAVYATGDFSVQYVPPPGASTDMLTVKVTSLCNDFAITASLPVEIIA